MMSETNAERNNQVLDALQEQKEMMMNNFQEQEQNQPNKKADIEEDGKPMNVDGRDPTILDYQIQMM